MWAAGFLLRPSTHASWGTVAHAALGEGPPPQWQELLVPGGHTVQAHTRLSGWWSRLPGPRSGSGVPHPTCGRVCLFSKVGAEWAVELTERGGPPGLCPGAGGLLPVPASVALG